MEENLLYTQEDIDEWMKTCEELQDKIKEQEEEIERLSKENSNLVKSIEKGFFTFKTTTDKNYSIFDTVRKVEAEKIFNKLIEVSKNFNGNIPIGVLKAWAIEYEVDINDIK